jgi:carbonic anhydrase/acetyltransferase-like protein (isoleucine patch superfamily)
MALLVSVGCGGGDDDSPTVGSDTPTSTSAGGATATTTASAATVLTATVRGGSVVEGGSRQRATLGQPVTIRVTSDVADEVHIHGYDKKFNVAAGQTAEVTFSATIPGVFEVELEKSKKVLFTMEVR